MYLCVKKAPELLPLFITAGMAQNQLQELRFDVLDIQVSKKHILACQASVCMRQKQSWEYLKTQF